jgi:hypothetical protein
MNNDEINRLQAQIDALQEQLSVMKGEAEPERSSRRGMLKLAAGAAVGAVAGGLALSSPVAHAGGGSSYNPTDFFYPMNPTRVYDSRWTALGSGLGSANLGRLSPNASRTVAVTRGRSESGTVTNSQFLPPGEGLFEATRVSAVAYNLTATGGTGVNYLAISSGDITSKPATSAINFSANQNIANGGITRVYWDTTSRSGVGDYEIKVWCGDDVGSVHFIVDVVGFWWNSPFGPSSPWAPGI